MISLHLLSVKVVTFSNNFLHNTMVRFVEVISKNMNCLKNCWIVSNFQKYINIDIYIHIYLQYYKFLGIWKKCLWTWWMINVTGNYSLCLNMHFPFYKNTNIYNKKLNVKYIYHSDHKRCHGCYLYVICKCQYFIY